MSNQSLIIRGYCTTRGENLKCDAKNCPRTGLVPLKTIFQPFKYDHHYNVCAYCYDRIEKLGHRE